MPRHQPSVVPFGLLDPRPFQKLAYATNDSTVVLYLLAHEIGMFSEDLLQKKKKKSILIVVDALEMWAHPNPETLSSLSFIPLLNFAERLLGLGQEERRKEYGENYVALDKIPTWRNHHSRGKAAARSSGLKSRSSKASSDFQTAGKVDKWWKNV